MKKYLLIISLITGLKGISQIPNAGFENWTSTASYTVPTGWTTSGYGADSTYNAYSGNRALVIWTWYTYAIGYAYNGQDVSSFDFHKSGSPCTVKATSLNGFYKFDTAQVATKDSAVIMVLLKKYNTTLHKVDTVGFALHKLPAANNYIPFSVPIADKMPGINPDSIVIVFSSQKRLFDFSSAQNTCRSTTNDCAYFHIDDISLSTVNSVIDITDLFTGNVYPNPAKNTIQFNYMSENVSISEQLKISDQYGKIIYLKSIQPGSSINIENFANGVYYYTIQSQKNISLKQGKFIVVN